MRWSGRLSWQNNIWAGSEEWEDANHAGADECVPELKHTDCEPHKRSAYKANCIVLQNRGTLTESVPGMHTFILLYN